MKPIFKFYEPCSNEENDFRKLKIPTAQLFALSVTNVRL